VFTAAGDDNVRCVRVDAVLNELGDGLQRIALGERNDANSVPVIADPQFAFPGQGQMKPEQLEIERLRREVQKLKAERDILKKAAAYFAKESR